MHPHFWIQKLKPQVFMINDNDSESDDNSIGKEQMTQIC